MGLHTDIRALYPGTEASLSGKGWSRVAAAENFDSRFLSAADGEGGGLGGASSHGHVCYAHGHTGVAHLHEVEADPSPDDTSTTAGDTGDAYNYSGATAHAHDPAYSSLATITYQTTVATISDYAGEIRPPCYQMLVIKPDDGNQELPVGACGFLDQSSVPSGFTKCDGSGGTPNLSDKFIQGADSGDSGGGDTGGTSDTHYHEPAADHTHTVNTHTHAAALLGEANPSVLASTDTGITNARGAYHHQKSLLASSGGALSTDSAGNTSAVAVEPAHVKLYCVQNTGASANTPDGIILIWVGIIADIPAGWSLCDGTGNTLDLRSRQIKVTNSSGEIGDLAGSNSHSHSQGSHTHTHASHSDHLIGAERDIATVKTLAGSAATVLEKTAHNHTWNVDPTTATMIAGGALGTTSNDHRYLYREVCFVKKCPVRVRFQGGKLRGGSLAAA